MLQKVIHLLRQTPSYSSNTPAMPTIILVRTLTILSKELDTTITNMFGKCLLTPFPVSGEYLILSPTSFNIAALVYSVICILAIPAEVIIASEFLYLHPYLYEVILILNPSIDDSAMSMLYLVVSQR